MKKENIKANDNHTQPLIEKNSKEQNTNSNRELTYPININTTDNFDESNKISTSKFQWYNCVPKIMIEQFSKMANIYFLLIAIMQSIEEISISGGKPVILLPFAVVISINGLKDFLEDWKRKRADDDENNRNIEIFNFEKNQFQKKTWQEVKIGNLIKVYENEFIPADIILLKTHKTNNNDGICYIESKNLDGETSLKYKECNKDISKYYSEENELRSIRGKVDCEEPNEFIYDFNARLTIALSERPIINIEKNSFILRGCSLKQTSYIFGLVVYIGHNTKIMKNSPSARSKTSRLESIMNFQVIIVLLIQFVLSSLALFSFLTWSKYSNNINNDNILNDDKDLIFYISRIGTWILIFTNLVPISLLVSLEMVKFAQGIFISWDTKLHLENDIDSGCKVQTSTLNEELGQVKVIFSDKTGTLTKNKMEFKVMSIGNYVYGDLRQINNENGDINNVKFVNNEVNDFFSHSKNENHDNYHNISMFMMSLSLCHTVFTKEIPSENSNDPIIIYQEASSPDELSLVSAARIFGYKFMKREIGNQVFLKINNKLNSFKITHILEYSSDRKRMSVIVKSPDGKIYLFSKGADSVMKNLITQNLSLIKTTEKFVSYFANSGLRTLMIAYKELSETEIEKFDKQYQIERNKDNHIKMNELFQNMEKGLYLLGSTGIEDQLQDNIADTLNSFIDIGIKMWVLTGDKVETAISVAFSCNLLTKDFEIMQFKEELEEEELEKQLDRFIDNENHDVNKKIGLIICSDELALMLGNSRLRKKFYFLSLKCNSILCCRASPKQKAQIVNIVKDYSPDIITLAIGDGANDVNMITCAHIGVGIRGVEGRQASRASDYSISQFKFLKRLLFVHGRESYRKNSFFVVYNFYKNIIFVVPQFWFGFVSLFSGQPLYDPYIYQLYNMIFTCFPICWFGIYDKEFSYDNILELQNKYYLQGMRDKLFHSVRFWKWILLGGFQSVAMFFYSFYAISNNDGVVLDLISTGSIIYSSVVIIVNLKILMYTSSHTIWSFLLIFGSILSYYLVLIYMSKRFNFENFANLQTLFSSSGFYLSSVLMIFMCIILDEGLMKILRIFKCIKDPTTKEESDQNQFLIKLSQSNDENIGK